MTSDGAGDAPAIHDLAARGFTAAADAYERSRPDYPAAAVAQLVDRLRLGPGRIVLDLGAGTGKLTRLLTPTGARVIALEPLPAMRAKLTTAAPGAAVLDGTAEAIPLADASVDGAVCAQAFHWFDAERALAAIHRVLRPDGWLVLIWNERDETVPWVKAMDEFIGPLQEGIPRHQDGEWRPAVDRSRLFEFVETTLVPHRQRLSPDGVIDRLASMSVVAAAPADVRERLFADVAEFLRSDPETAGRDEIELPYTTELHWLRRVEATG
jgi:SAM-dependent methyltransferase